MRTSVFLLLITCLISGCTVGPNYKKPAVNTPSVYRGLTPDEAGKNDPTSLGDEKWLAVVQEQQLQDVIKTALQQNYDVRRAAARILQAQAAVVITRSQQFPTVNGQAEVLDERTARSKVVPPIATSANQVGVNFNSELDFWGRFRRATEAARADVATAEWGQKEILRQLASN